MIGRLLKLTIAILFFIGYKTYIIICGVCGKYLPSSLVILTYHPIKASDSMQFEKQMNMLLKAGMPVTLEGDMSMLPGKHNIAVSFDDSYQSVLQNALPILREKNIPATIFVPTGCLGSKPLWIKNPSHIYASETVMTEAQLKALPPDLIGIGSHTVSHMSLTNIDKRIARREIFESKETLERILNKKILLFAAPYATFNDKFTDMVKQAGYRRLFLNIPTFPATKTDLYVLGRTSVEPTDWPIEYYLKLSGAFQWMPLAINLKNKLQAFSKNRLCKLF